MSVTNVAPSAVSLALTPASLDEGGAAAVTGSFADPGSLDTHVVVISWGDGSPNTTLSLATGQFDFATAPHRYLDDGSYTVQATVWDGAGTVAGSHVYTTGGFRTIVLTIADDDSASGQASTPAVITGVGVNNGVLQIVGTSCDDQVKVKSEGKNPLVVQASFLEDRAHKRVINPAGIQRIEIYLGGGDDEGWVDDDILIPVFIDGGDGNDHLRAGGAAVLLGGKGDDHLEGGKGRNILIGGLSEDHINGRAGDDILIGGTTTFDANRDALMSILAEWNSSRDFVTRVANLRGIGTGPRLNGSFFLSAGLTVFDNGEADWLNGGAGRDWIFGGRRDHVLWQCGDLVDLLSSTPACRW